MLQETFPISSWGTFSAETKYMITVNQKLSPPPPIPSACFRFFATWITHHQGSQMILRSWSLSQAYPAPPKPLAKPLFPWCVEIFWTSTLSRVLSLGLPSRGLSLDVVIRKSQHPARDKALSPSVPLSATAFSYTPMPAPSPFFPVRVAWVPFFPHLELLLHLFCTFISYSQACYLKQLKLLQIRACLTEGWG